MAANNLLSIEVAYATPEQQTIIPLSVSATCSVQDAISQSGILQQHPEIDLNVNSVGIFSKQVSLNTMLRSGDRVEIYRPLAIDPKKARLQRAGKQSRSRVKK